MLTFTPSQTLLTGIVPIFLYFNYIVIKENKYVQKKK